LRIMFVSCSSVRPASRLRIAGPEFPAVAVGAMASRAASLKHGAARVGVLRGKDRGEQ